MTLMQLREQRAAALTACKDLLAVLGQYQGEGNAPEQAAFDAAKAKLARIDALIADQESIDAAERSGAAMAVGSNPRISGGELAAAVDPARGWANIGEFAMAVYGAARKPHAVDHRLLIGAAPSTFGNESSMADGGFLVPPEFSATIREHMLDEGGFLSMTDGIPVTGNSMTFPADETTPWGSDGVRAYWESEGAAATPTKPKGKLRSLRLNKLFALVPVTDELVSDAAALGAYLPRKTGASIAYKSNDSLINGDGVGKPLGILNAGALVTVTKESGQAAATFVAGNAAKMYSRMPPRSMARAVWAVHHEVLPQMMQMSIGNQPVWAPNFQVAPGGTLFGRPVFITQSCQALGTKGDVYFADWMSMVSINKGLQTDSSIHFYFDSGHTAFRAIFRVDAQPWLDAAMTPARGSASQSPFVTLETRS